MEIFLLIDDPWRVLLTTDHPIGPPFTAYPDLVRLADETTTFAHQQLAKLPTMRLASGAAATHPRISLDEIAIMTRAGPARTARPERSRPPGCGRGADIAIYREGLIRRNFRAAARVFKDGDCVARDGNVSRYRFGALSIVAPEADRGDAANA